ncbi:MAG: response regulator [Phycisphaerales bacterium]|nr:response regulator [Phycisphaerales bacterium]
MTESVTEFEGPKRLLVADDEHLVAMGMKNNLEELGYEVIGPAGDGQAAITLCETLKPDMALLDIQMPGLDGLAAAEKIYQEMQIPVVIFSAYSDQEYVDSSNDAGVFGYILKPVTRDQLRVGIEVAWGRYLDSADQIEEISGLKERLEQRKIIEQAKWILVKRKSVEEPEAMKMLQKQARNNRRSLIDVARAVVESDSLLSE